MARLFLIALLVLSSGPAYAEWVAVAEGDQSGTTVYANPDTIRRKEEMVTMWVLFDLKTIENVEAHSYLSMKGKSEYDCDGERSRSLTLTEFSGNMGRGEAVFSTSREGPWAPVDPESIGQLLWTFACTTKK